jgi:hypothetical protein
MFIQVFDCITMGANYSSIKSAEHIESLMSNKDLSKVKYEFKIHETMIANPEVLDNLCKYLPKTKKWKITIYINKHYVSNKIRKIVNQLLSFNNGDIYYNIKRERIYNPLSYAS